MPLALFMGGVAWGLDSCAGDAWAARSGEQAAAILPDSTGIQVDSTDTDEKTWTEYAATLPWPDKLCDYRGFYSPPMIAYGVAATPTLFLIDGKGTVVEQYATFGEVWELICNEN